MSTSLNLLDAQAAGCIGPIRGKNSNIGMVIEIRNDTDEPMTITSEAGTVIGSRDPDTQRMVIIRDASWTIPPHTRQPVEVDALCIEAHKGPPIADVDEENHRIERTIDNDDVRKLLSTLHTAESKISAGVTSTGPDARTFSHTLKEPGLVELATVASHVRGEGGAIQSKIAESVVQMPLWQLTDHLKLAEYAQIVGKKEFATRQELRQSVEVLANFAMLAENLLREAELAHKQTIKAPDGELEILFCEHDLLSAEMSRLRRAAIGQGGDTDSVRRLRERTLLLKDLEREILTVQRKDSLIDDLLSLPVTGTYSGRTHLLNGIHAESLQRSEGMSRHDLDLIVTQLAQLGRDEGGEILLIRMIGNAMRYAEGFEVHSRLVALRDELARI